MTEFGNNLSSFWINELITKKPWTMCFWDDKRNKKINNSDNLMYLWLRWNNLLSTGPFHPCAYKKLTIREKRSKLILNRGVGSAKILGSGRSILKLGSLNFRVLIYF